MLLDITVICALCVARVKMADHHCHSSTSKQPKFSMKQKHSNNLKRKTKSQSLSLCTTTWPYKNFFHKTVGILLIKLKAQDAMAFQLFIW